MHAGDAIVLVCGAFAAFVGWVWWRAHAGVPKVLSHRFRCCDCGQASVNQRCPACCAKIIGEMNAKYPDAFRERPRGGEF